MQANTPLNLVVPIAVKQKPSKNLSFHLSEYFPVASPPLNFQHFAELLSLLKLRGALSEKDARFLSSRLDFKNSESYSAKAREARLQVDQSLDRVKQLSMDLVLLRAACQTLEARRKRLRTSKCPKRRRRKKSELDLKFKVSAQLN